MLETSGSPRLAALEFAMSGKEFANFSEEVGLAKTRIFSLLEARSGTLWFGSITGGASRL